MPTTSPNDQNLFQGSKYSLNFDRLPYIQFFVTSVNIPGMSTHDVSQDTPFRNAPTPGNKMEYDALAIEFLVDEQLRSWSSIRDWMSGIAFPESFDQYKALSLQTRIQTFGGKPQYSDASLTIYSNKNNAILKLAFSDVFPTILSGIQLSTADTALEVKKASAQFKFLNYDIIRP